jgi:hypothetical protein
MTAFHLDSRDGHPGCDTAHPSPPCTLTGARLKVTTTLEADELLVVPAPGGGPRIALSIRLPERTLAADIAAKSPRKAQAAIREVGADSIVLGGLPSSRATSSPRPAYGAAGA